MALLEVFLEFAEEVKKVYSAKNAEIETLKSENTDLKDKLATALANDAADAATIDEARTAASVARDELAAFKESVANDEESKKIEAAIANLRTELGIGEEAVA